MDRFVDPPRTLYDEIGEQEQDVFITVKSAEEHIEKDWNIIVMQLQQQNESLMQTLQETTNDLEKSRHEKKELEYFIEQQMNMHEQTVEELNDKINQLEEKFIIIQEQKSNETILDLIYQKNYLMLENDRLKESEARLLKHVNVQPLQQKSQLSRWRSTTYALIAVQRFQKLIQ
ncbi:hypothetical protein G6F57_008517 [Rhizopus arrhizus]|uniref:Pericentrin/AKAP-450 centrosomal targeting domain-containing protein n=1 Tax=Rhizopus oryzae TaxID=64495 RepID=A0A9P7BWI5_RHIOR|nr:hypothetical protein G6F23_003751 [Rhizopus arrhizus]KAG0760343.1 hypothetical protein G6F24_008387 [Rhizopus arrhizus]KAG0793542.1 hypothetical protein G6F21_003540 [Rhizopus arrhizus]KAG0798201.1 hypothetical protein G6F22_004458 [Rhizopus arrhizus]KAG0808453.1 hypothetical protein G6F20_009564 [Rhizopus arrhizus]